MGKKKKNIIWIVVDCVRNYQSGTDDRDKLDIMYELENEFTSFGNMMVSAPSSIMSAVNFFQEYHHTIWQVIIPSFNLITIITGQ